MFRYLSQPVAVTRRGLALTAAIGALAGALLAIPLRMWTTEAPWESVEQAEGAVHEAVTRMADRGELAQGDTFVVREIRGEVGPHNSPWHITYTVIIEKTGS